MQTDNPLSACLHMLQFHQAISETSNLNSSQWANEFYSAQLTMTHKSKLASVTSGQAVAPWPWLTGGLVLGQGVRQVVYFYSLFTFPFCWAKNFKQILFGS